MTAPRRKKPDAEELWSAFCAVCRRIVAEGVTEPEVRAAWIAHQLAEHPSIPEVA